MSVSVYKTIDTVTVNGSNKYLRGYIYDVNFQPSMGKEPSRLSISVINEDGVYSTPVLTVQQPSQIKIGTINLNMYPIKYTQKESSQGKILEIEFIDGSFIFNKIYVGLIKKHWQIPLQNTVSKNNIQISNYFAPYTINNNFIILGRELHPCDVNKDGSVDYGELNTAVDPCDPCPSCPQDKYSKQEKCDKLSYQKVFDVAYTFFELLDGISAIASNSGINIKITKPFLPEEKIKKFLKSYTGTLKQVLDQWCSDLGLAAIFDPVENELFFRDLTADVKLDESAINAIVDNSNVKIISKEVQESMENTFSHGSISLYERNGETKPYTCEKSQSFVLPIVSDFDIQGERKRKVYAAQGRVDVDWRDDTTSAILATYSEEMREAFWMRYVYGIIDSTQARNMKQKFELGKGSANRSTGFFEGIDRKIPEMGNLTIIQVIEDTGNLKPAEIAKLSAEDKLACNQYGYLTSRITDPIAQSQFKNNKGFFVIAYHEKELYNKRLDFEKKVFESFGRFYVREGFVKLCGITGDAATIRQNTDLFAGDGASVDMIGRGYDVNNLPFQKYPYDTEGYLGCLVYPFKEGNPLSDQGKGAQTNKPPVSPYQSLETKETNVDPNIAKPYFGPSILIVDREPKWSPLPENTDSFKDIFEKYKTYAISEYGTDGGGGVGAAAYPQELNEVLKINAIATASNRSVDPLPGNIKLYAMIPGKFDHKWDYNKSDHPTERLGKEVSPNAATDKNTIPGIIDKKCSVLTIDNSFKIFAPPLSLMGDTPKEGNKDNDNPCDDYIKNRDPAFRILVTQKFNQSKEVGKIQSVQSNLPNTFQENTLKFELNYLNITDNDFQALTSNCYPSAAYLKSIHEDYNLRQTSSLQENLKKLSFKLKGIPNIELRTALELGLEQLNFTYSSDGGVCSISFGNSFAERLSLETLRAGFAYNQSQQKAPETPTTIR